MSGNSDNCDFSQSLGISLISYRPLAIVSGHCYSYCLGRDRVAPTFPTSCLHPFSSLPGSSSRNLGELKARFSMPRVRPRVERRCPRRANNRAAFLKISSCARVCVPRLDQAHDAAMMDGPVPSTHPPGVGSCGGGEALFLSRLRSIRRPSGSCMFSPHQGGG